jgi:acyl-coenzyme A thioesterase PaaI-like protein
MGFDVRGMGEGASHVALPWRPGLADGPGFHEGALLALLDCAGAMSSHAAHGGNAVRNATIALQAQILAPQLPGADMVAFGRCATRDDDVFWNEVRIARDSNRELLARGSVIYRIGS